MIRAGYRWDVLACFRGCGAVGVRVAVRKTRRGALRFAEILRQALGPHVEQAYVRLRHDPLFDEVMSRRIR